MRVAFCLHSTSWWEAGEENLSMILGNEVARFSAILEVEIDVSRNPYEGNARVDWSDARIDWSDR